MSRSPFIRADGVPAPVSEPYASVMALLDDLHEQAELYRPRVAHDPQLAVIIDSLMAKIVGLALVVSLMPGARGESGPTRPAADT